MSIETQLDLRSPLIWIPSSEPYRIIERVIDHVGDDRKVYRMDGFRGLVIWSDNKWLQYLVDDPVSNQKVPCYAVDRAIHEIAGTEDAKDMVFILDHAHETSKAVIPQLHETVLRYIDAIRHDDATSTPLQVILIAAKDEPPVEIMRNIARVDFDLPTREELAHLTVDLYDNLEAPVPDGDDLTKIVRAGQGLSELEFTRASLECIRDTGTIDPEQVNHIKIETIKAMGMIEVRPPSIHIDDIGGLDLAKDLITRIQWTWDNIERAQELGIKPMRRLLLIGVPGSGKSAMCEALASSVGHDLAITGVSKALSKWVGESEQNMRAAFRQVAAMSPVTMWIDEFGRDVSGSGVANDSGTTDRVHGEFLTGLQELPDDVMLVCAANRIDGLPPEMLRADRFDRVMFVGFPVRDERVDIFKIHLGESYIDFDVERLADETEFFTGAEIKALVAETRFNVSTLSNTTITTDDIIQSIPSQRNRVWVRHRDDMLEMYDRAVKEWYWASSAQQESAKTVINNGRLDVTNRPNGTKTAATIAPHADAKPALVIPKF